ncbi:MAG: TPM domain-containing protein [Sphingobacteriia bacterium]|nr:TPM domain-containing protein [Sphingobacteriia bacterium]
MPTAKNFFSQEQKERIRLAIMDGELNTSGEIRVHIEEVCEEDVMDRASYVFGKLSMHKTKERNGVLFYLAFKNRKFAIIGDAGINAVVDADFWNEAKHRMLVQFREDKFTEGLIAAIEQVSQQLKQHFPRQRDDVNELSDEISFGKL